MKSTDALARALTHPSEANEHQPYPPSWIDRFTAWLERLPFHPWLGYSGLWLLFFLPYSAVKWWDRAYPIGTFNGFHLLLTGTGVVIIALMHYLDHRAGAALAAFRPVLTVDSQSYAELHFRLTTCPPGQHSGR